MKKLLFVLMILAFPLCKGEGLNSPLYKEKLDQDLKEMTNQLSQNCKLPEKLISLCESEKSPSCPHFDNDQKDESYYCWRCKKSRNHHCHALKQFFAYSSEQNDIGEAYWHFMNMDSKDIRKKIGYNIRNLEDAVDLEPQDSIELIKQTTEKLKQCSSLSKRIKETEDLIKNYSAQDKETRVILKDIISWFKS